MKEQLQINDVKNCTLLKSPLFDNYIYVDSERHVWYRANPNMVEGDVFKDGHDHWLTSSAWLEVLTVNVESVEKANEIVDQLEGI